MSIKAEETAALLTTITIGSSVKVREDVFKRIERAKYTSYYGLDLHTLRAFEHVIGRVLVVISKFEVHGPPQPGAHVVWVNDDTLVTFWLPLTDLQIV